MTELRYFARRVLSTHSDERPGDHWQAFLSGRWQLIDHFDSEGRRYVIARRAPKGDLLSRDEQLLLRRRAHGEALKVLAFDLGTSVSAVSRRLARAMRKLGVRSHAELPRLFAAFEQSAP